MIKIEPFIATDYAQARALFKYEPEPNPIKQECSSKALFLRGLAFWQHWLPFQLHIAPSVYVAKEDGVVLGLIVLRSLGKSKLCWQVDHLIVHPHHRGRGVAQELLRYAFALFGSQGASHFVAEVSDLNSAALSLYGSCGFRRCAKVTLYQVEINAQAESKHLPKSCIRLAKPSDKRALFQLHQESLPPDIRMIISYTPDDFQVSEFRLEGRESLRHRVMRRHGWFWVVEDNSRHTLTAAIKVTCHQPGDYHFELAIHPGWTNALSDIVEFALDNLRQRGEVAIVTARAFDYQSSAAASLEAAGMERIGDFTFLTKEHWLRARYPRKNKERTLGMPVIAKPAVNLPMISDL